MKERKNKKDAGSVRLGMEGRIAVLNRQEAALRCIRAIRDINSCEGTRFEDVVVLPRCDRGSLVARIASRVVFLPSDTAAGYRASDSLIELLKEHRIQAVWPGWGFDSENWQLADSIEKAGMVFLGPTADSMRQLGDKIASKRTAQSVGVPVIPWRLVESEADLDQVQEIGFPLILKASGGGGGRGIRLVQESGRLVDAYRSVQAEAPGEIFAEKLVSGGRHVEVQVLADTHGNVVSFGTRDCSLQRRRQKVLEEAPCSTLPPELLERVEGYSRKLAAAVGYRSAGTCEYLVDAQGNPYFMEMNTRIQVEHTVTEEAYGVDLVREQIHVAQGCEIRPRGNMAPGHCVEVRVYAEDPSSGFVPAPGKIRQIHFGQGPGIRVDCGVGVGEEISPHFDAMIAKVMARGRTREEALTRLARALEETRIQVEGGTTNIPFLRFLVADPDVREGKVDTTLIERRLLDAYLEFPEELRIPAMVAAGICEHRKREKESIANFAARPMITGAVDGAQTINLTGFGRNFAAQVLRTGLKEYLFKTSNGYFTASWIDEGGDESLLEYDGHKYKISVETKSAEWRLYVDGKFTVIRLADRGVVRAPAPAIVTAVHVEGGQEIHAGQRLFTLEAMKMELPVHAAEDGIVEKIEVMPGSQVFAGGVLMRIRPRESEGGENLDVPVEPAFPTPRQALKLLEGVMLGYDVGTAEQELAHRRFASALWEEFGELVPEIFETVIHFATAAEVLSHQPRHLSESNGKQLRSSRAILTDFIRRPNFSMHQLPAQLRQGLERLLPLLGFFQLEESSLHPLLFRLRRVLNRSSARKAACMTLLSFLYVYRDSLENPPEEMRNALRTLSIDAEGNSRQTDVVETIRATLYDQPERRRTEERIRDMLRKITRESGWDKDALKKKIRHARHSELVILHGNPSVESLELMAWAFWGEMIQEFQPVPDSPVCAILLRIAYQRRDMERRFSGRRRFFCMLDSQNWRETLNSMMESVARSQADSMEIVLDALTDETESVCNFLNSLPVSCTDVTLVDLHRDRTRVFRSPIGHAFVEEMGLCGLHPAQAARFELWRFAEFQLTRLDCEDVILFHAKARSFPEDERIIAMTEVFDPEIRTDHQGRRRFPGVSMAFRAACQAIRQQQSRRARNERLHWNHLLMGVYPLPQLDAAEMKAIAEDLLPYTTRLGLEQVTVNTVIENTRFETQGFYKIKIRGRASEGISIDTDVEENALVMPLREEEREEIKARRRGIHSPEAMLRILRRDTQGRMTGKFTPYDVIWDPIAGNFFPVANESVQLTRCGTAFGVLDLPSCGRPEGLSRVVILSNPLQNMGSLAEPECSRIIAALDLAQERGLGVLWVPISAGAHIDFDSGTENLDWTARVLRRIVEFTDAGGRIDILVSGVNVGAQSYFDAEATMTISTKGFLVMTQEGSMVLTGKRALDFSGAVSAEDNLGIGGFERIMGPSGQAQALVGDIAAGHHLLTLHAELVTPGPDGKPVILATGDAEERNICEYPYPARFGHDFRCVGDIFSEEHNPGRKKPFSVQPVMHAVRDADAPWVERWSAMVDGAEGVVVSETRVGGIPVGMIGVEAMGFPRMGQIPPDGPENWTPSTLFPRGSYKIARALSAFSGQVPAIILANLSGFDGSPESLRSWQLIHGAEIGRALVNFKGPVLLTVLSRYHGGAYVVFSTALNSRMEAIALSGSYASVIGGAAAAAVVFDSSISAEVEKNPEVARLRKLMETAAGKERIRIESRLEELRLELKVQLQKETAERFDRVHSVQRAARVGSLKTVIEPFQLRPYIIGFLRTHCR